ncbi:hypothetical protein [Alteromonas sp. H39]
MSYFIFQQQSLKALFSFNEFIYRATFGMLLQTAVLLPRLA